MENINNQQCFNVPLDCVDSAAESTTAFVSIRERPMHSGDAVRKATVTPTFLFVFGTNERLHLHRGRVEIFISVVSYTAGAWTFFII